MLTRLLIVASLLFAALFQTAFSQFDFNGGVSLLVDPGFDDPRHTEGGSVEQATIPNGWRVDQGSVTTTSINGYTSGQYAAQFTPYMQNGGTGVARISQPVVLIERGQLITVQFQLKFIENGGGIPREIQAFIQFDTGAPIELETTGGPVDDGPTPANGFSLQTSFPIPAPVDSVGTLTLIFRTRSRILYLIDDITLSGPALIIGDPQFVGLRGQSYQVHGVDGEVYNLVSSANTQVNSRFVFLNGGKCPIFEGVPAKNCWSHPGSYLGAIGVQQIVDGKVQQLSIVSGSAKTGFASITLNGKSLAVGAKVDGELFSVNVSSTHSIQVSTEEFSFTFENSDMFINQGVSSRKSLSALTAHGLFGQTHQSKVYNSAIKYIDGEVDDYVIADNELFGKDFVYNQFQL